VIKSRTILTTARRRPGGQEIEGWRADRHQGFVRYALGEHRETDERLRRGSGGGCEG
jgi:hypothetical protein